MRKIFCKVKHNPPHTYGDCIRACLESITGIDGIPHTHEYGKSGVSAWDDIRAFLKTKGRTVTLFSTQIDPREYMKSENPDIPYLLLGQNRRDDHCVVCRNDEIIHDPSWVSSDMVGPHSVAGCWIIGLIGVTVE